MTKCVNCHNECPSGTLPNGLCSECDMIGKEIRVTWGMFGLRTCKVDHVTRNGRVYARRWIQKRKDWSSAQPIKYYKGTWYLAK